jgi:acylphosphatase
MERAKTSGLGVQPARTKRFRNTRTADQMSAEATLAALQSPAAVRLRICGRVQGVGLRPFVARLAQQFGIAGSVQNQLGEVEIVAEGTQQQIESFTAALIRRAPPLATLRLDSCESLAPSHRRGCVVLKIGVTAIRSSTARSAGLATR